MHIKDSGTVLLTNEELKEIMLNKVPERIRTVWGLNLEELKSIIEKKQYQLIEEEIDGTETRTIKNDSGESS